MKSAFSIRSLLFLLALSVTVPLVILLAYTLYTAVTTETQNARTNALAVADAAADDIEAFLQDTQQRIVGLAEHSEIRAALQDSLTCSRTAQTLQSVMPEASFVVVLDERGKLICSTTPIDTTYSAFAQQTWFLSALDANQPIITSSQSEISPNRKALFFAYPVTDNAALERGVLVVGVDLAQLENILARQHSTPDQILVLLDDKDTVLAMAPDPNQLSGANLQTTAFAQPALSTIKSDVEAQGLDGIARIFGLSAIPQTKWRVMAGIPTGLAFASAWRIALINGVLLLAAIFFVAAAARWYSKRIEHPIQTLVEATTAVAQGDLSTRVTVRGPTELTLLAEQFNAMVDAREAYDNALRQSKEKYRTLTEQIPAVVYRTTSDRENSALFVNSEINDLLGYSPQEWLANPQLWYERVHPDDRARVLAELQELRSTDRPLTLEYRMYARDDTLVWVRDSVRALSQAHGKPRILQGVLFDITAHKRANEQLAYHANLLDQVHDAIIATDADEKITAWNRAAAEMYGWRADEALGACVHTIVPTEMAEEAARARQETLHTQGAARNQVKQYRRTGEPLIVETTTMTLRNAAGEITGYVSVNRDVTQHKAVEQALTRRTAHAEALANTAAAMNAQLEFHAVVRSIVLETQCALNTQIVLLFLYQEATNTFQLVEAAGLSPARVAQLKQAPYVHPLAFDSPASLYSRNWSALAMWSNAGTGDLPALTGALTVPMRHKQDWVGLLCAVTTESGRVFSSDDCELLSSLADQAALAISNARLFDQVRAGRARLQSLSRRLVEIQESERHAIARELHDEIGQALTGLSLVLEMATRASTNGIHANLAEAQSIVNQIMKQVRNLSLELRPAMLDDLGLMPALTWHMQRYMTQTGIQVDMKAKGLEGKRFPPAIETAAYRIVQEALTNVARYAHVKEVKVRVWSQDTALGLMVEDQGSGFDVDAALTSNRSSGLLGMRERAILLGGQLVLESTPGQGTRITATLPLQGFVERRMRERGA
jgi:PAS domain S-box-containing protein